MSGAREEILARIRSRLPPERSLDAAAPPVRRAPGLPSAEHLERFRANLERVGGYVHVAASAEDACRRALELTLAARARRVALSDAPLVADLARRFPPGVVCSGPDAPRAELLEAEVGITGAQWGIAETGTLVLESARERHRLVSLLPPVHVALLPRSALLGTLGEALEALGDARGRPASRTITLITGPSRTADIELVLVVGVHGPRELHAIVFADPSQPGRASP